MTNYSKLFKAILGGSVGIGTIIGVNTMTKLFKVDRLDREIDAMANNINSIGGGAKGEPFEVEFADDEFVSDQEVENRI
jgi:hypothetical protein